MTAPQMKPWIAAIDPYVPGRARTDAHAHPAKLSANEQPLGPSPLAVAAMQAAAGAAHRYPDPGWSALKTALADAHGLEAERIVCGTGSDELLQLLPQAFAGPGDEVLYSEFGFSIYPIAARRCGATPVVAPEVDYTAEVDAMLAAVTERTRVVFLANPNNPTGTLLSKAEVHRLHAGLRRDIVFVYDAAYGEYLDGKPDYESGFDLVRGADNVITTRTFSKLHGLAAERIGWAYSTPAIIDALQRIRAPFNVTAMGQAAAIAAIGDRQWAARARAHNAEWRGWLAAEIAALGNHGLRAVPSAANFILVTFPSDGRVTAERANAALEAAGYLVRWPKGQGLGHALRITIGTEAEVRGVAAALRAFCETE